MKLFLIIIPVLLFGLHSLKKERDKLSSILAEKYEIYKKDNIELKEMEEMKENSEIIFMQKSIVHDDLFDTIYSNIERKEFNNSIVGKIVNFFYGPYKEIKE